MAWEFGLTYVDYDGNRSTTNHTVSGAIAGGNDGAEYDLALSEANGALAFAQAHSLANVYLSGPTFNRENVLARSNDISAKNAIRLKVVFDLDGKTQKGRMTIPAPDETLVRGTDRKVNNTTVSNLGLVNMYLTGNLVVSDGDTADFVSDADIISTRGLVSE